MQSLRKQLICLTAVALLSAASSQAAVVYFSGQNLPIPSTYAGISVNLETGSNGNALSGISGGAVNLYFGGENFSNDAEQAAPSAIFQPVRTSASNTGSLKNMAVNDVVDSTVNVSANLYGMGFGGSSSHIGPQFTAGTPGYMGFSLLINSGSDLVYGWMKVTFQDDGVTPGVIHEWAYESTPNSGILVGVVPEPGSLLLFGVGITGILLRRRR